MLPLEHAIAVIKVCAAVFGLFLFGALSAQLVDIDHVCFNCKSEISRLKTLWKCSHHTSVECDNAIDRGFMHSKNTLIIVVALWVVFTGFVFGYVVHIICDSMIKFANLL
jgi:hypothetical protein